ncbi:MAG TPA: V-type ATP synthase subunit D [Vicinamibacterales bacterium]|nr:V-type ATP synthase subunit D [Vicinamibacterales bacterium]
MALAPSRWRLIELVRKRAAVRAGVDLLERKREALIRELENRVVLAEERRGALAAALQKARARLEHAVVDIGAPAAEAAALAQALPGSLRRREEVVLGVHLPRVAATFEPLRLSYGFGGTSASLDDAALAFRALLPLVVELAAQETAVRNLRRALQRTSRTLNALKDVLLPEVEADVRAVAAALEDEDRDERVRRLLSTAGRSRPHRGGTSGSVRGV